MLDYCSFTTEGIAKHVFEITPCFINPNNKTNLSLENMMVYAMNTARKTVISPKQLSGLSLSKPKTGKQPAQA